MKNDQQKPHAINFYWEGLRVIAKSDREVIEQTLMFEQFCRDRRLDSLRTLYWVIMDAHPDKNKLFEDVMHIYKIGADEYGDKNYLTLGVERFLDAMGRHLGKAHGATPLDESGYPHVAHVLANILIVAELL